MNLSMKSLKKVVRDSTFSLICWPLVIFWTFHWVWRRLPSSWWNCEICWSLEILLTSSRLISQLHRCDNSSIQHFTWFPKFVDFFHYFLFLSDWFHDYMGWPSLNHISWDSLAPVNFVTYFFAFKTAFTIK
jgi:hypothetical protein